MEDFVSNLIKTSDLRSTSKSSRPKMSKESSPQLDVVEGVLTTKAVRKAYEAHIKQSLSKDDKDKLKQFVSGLLDEIAQNLKFPLPVKPDEVQSPENTSQQNSEPQKTADGAKTKPTSASSNGLQSDNLSAKTEALESQNNSTPQKKNQTPKRSGKNVKTSSESDQNKVEPKKEKVKKRNGKFKPDPESDEDESLISEENETPTRKTSRRKNTKVNYVESDGESESESVEMVSPKKQKLANVPKKNASDSESDLPSDNEKHDSDESFVEEKSISKPNKSPKKKTPKKKLANKKSPRKRKKKMNVEEAVGIMMESDKDASSPVSIEIASAASSDTEIVDKTNKKRKHVSSDDDQELVIDEDPLPLETKKTAKKNVKPAAKRKKLLPEDVNSEDDDELLNKSNGKSEIEKMSDSEDLIDDEPVSKPKKSRKISNKKKINNNKEKGDSDEDDKPLKSFKNTKNVGRTTKRKAAAEKSKVTNEVLESDSDNEPVRPKWKPTAKASPIPKKKTSAEMSDLNSGSDVEQDNEPPKPIKKRTRATPTKQNVSDDSDIDEPLKPKLKPSAKASPIPKAKLDEANKESGDVSVEEESSLKSKGKTRKQIVESDSDGGFSESEDEPLKPAKGKKKKSPKRKPKKVKPEKSQVLKESFNHSDNEPPEPEKKPLILKIKKSDIKTVSESDEELLEQPKISPKVGGKKNGFDTDSEGSDDDSLHIDLGGSEPEDQANSEVSENEQSKKAASELDSDDSGTSMEVSDSPQTTKTKGKRAASSKVQKKMTNLRKICKAAGIILRNKIEFLGCDSEQEKITRIGEILRNRGMQGRPSLAKAEILKLKREAAELNTDNIISDKGRSKRKVKSRFVRGDNSPSPSPKKMVTPLKLKLSGLRGVIDSEGSESD